VSSPEGTRIIDLLRTYGVVRPRDLASHGLSRMALQRLVADGRIERIARGVYRLPGEPITHASLAEVSRRVPRGVICLISALEFHELTTQLAHEVWLAIGVKHWPPAAEYPPIRLVRFSGAALTEGVEVHDIGGTEVRIYSAAKTVADCFKFRNKIGVDVAVEALRDYRTNRRGTVDELWRFAKVCRVATVMKPYLEATS
jgi:predicted transcriptional regulator of viral defense system